MSNQSKAYQTSKVQSIPGSHVVATTTLVAIDRTNCVCSTSPHLARYQEVLESPMAPSHVGPTNQIASNFGAKIHFGAKTFLEPSTTVLHLARAS